MQVVTSAVSIKSTAFALEQPTDRTQGSWFPASAAGTCGDASCDDGFNYSLRTAGPADRSRNREDHYQDQRNDCIIAQATLLSFTISVSHLPTSDCLALQRLRNWRDATTWQSTIHQRRCCFYSSETYILSTRLCSCQLSFEHAHLPHDQSSNMLRQWLLENQRMSIQSVIEHDHGQLTKGGINRYVSA